MDAKNREIKKTKKVWYASEGGVSRASGKKRFLLRWHDDEDNEVYSKGPFYNEQKAIRALNDDLRRGVCSWLVSYDG
jgi:hypothetical protein